MRIRKKLIVLHTGFSLLLCAILLIALRPAISDVVSVSESEGSQALLDAVSSKLASVSDEVSPDSIARVLPPGASLRFGSAAELDVPGDVVALATGRPYKAFVTTRSQFGPGAIAFIPNSPRQSERFAFLSVIIPEARATVWKLYVILLVALLAVYALVALALETLVLPANVYGPIQLMLDADLAVREERRESELIESARIPSDELGEIMLSRNQTILRLRAQGRELAEALGRLEAVANDLKSKNHLLETARKSLADADRLASLGMMSAGIAHELNTPLSVLKGLAERLHANAGVIDPDQAALMRRVVMRIERLSESLLDFARVRPSQLSAASLSAIIVESVTLVTLDRETSGVPIRTSVPESIVIECDSDRLLQVFVNLIRNGASAAKVGEGGVSVDATMESHDGCEWVHVRIEDDGPGIEPDVLPRLFEPFVSTKLDSRGTGLGLAVAEGIVKDHGGIILARNRTDQRGAVFEVVLPVRNSGRGDSHE
jgi:signal transduction histidine kinase